MTPPPPLPPLQVTREIAGRPVIPTTRVRRCCCINMHESDKPRRGSPRPGAGPTSGSVSVTTRVRTANAHHTEPHPPPKQACITVPTAGTGSVRSRRSGASPYSPSSTRGTLVRAIRQEDTGEGARLGNICHASAIDEVEQTHENDQEPEALLDVPGSNDQADVCGRSSGTFRMGGSTDRSFSDNGVDIYGCLEGGSGNWSDSERIDSDSELSITSEESAGDLRPAGTCEEKGERADAPEGEPPSLPMEEGRPPPPAENNWPTKRRGRGRTFHRHRKGVDGGRDAKMRTESKRPGGSLVFDEAWSNRSLTVLLKEFGLYQSCQRTVLSDHMPAEQDADGGNSPRGLPPPPRIDRPHFTPAFVELPAAGKGRTVRPTSPAMVSASGSLVQTPMHTNICHQYCESVDISEAKVCNYLCA